MDEIFEKFEDFKEIFECFIYKKIERFNNNDNEIFEKLKYSKKMPKYLYIKRSIDFNNNNVRLVVHWRRASALRYNRRRGVAMSSYNIDLI